MRRPPHFFCPLTNFIVDTWKEKHQQNTLSEFFRRHLRDHHKVIIVIFWHFHVPLSYTQNVSSFWQYSTTMISQRNVIFTTHHHPFHASTNNSLSIRNIVFCQNSNTSRTYILNYILILHRKQCAKPNVMLRLVVINMAVYSRIILCKCTLKAYEAIHQGQQPSSLQYVEVKLVAARI